MKRKTIILLSSVLASSLLVGGAFAAYLVTDLATPKVIDITPGQAPPQDYVTLEWGVQTTYTSEFDEIEANKYYKAGYFVIKSDVAYEGIFSVKMQNTTIGKLEGEDMFDHIKLYAYQGDVDLEEEAIPSTAVPFTFEDSKEGEGVVTYSKLVATTSEGVGVTLFYRLECTDDQYAEMANDHVRLTVDWNMGPDSEPAQTEGYFLKLGDANPTALTENTDTDKTDGRIAEYTTTKEVVAGQAIKIVKDGVAADSEHVTFEENGNATSAGNIVASGESTFWIKVYNGQDEFVGQLFYVVYVTNPSSGVVVDDNVIFGTTNGGESWGNLAQLTVNPTKQSEVYIEGLQLAAGTEFTIHLTGDTYMEFSNIKASSPAKANFEQKKGDIADRYDNIVVTTDGTYDFYVDAGEDYGIYITETSGEQEETDYKLVGTIGGTNKWAYADGIQVTKLNDNHYQVASVELLAGDAIKMWNGKSGEQESWLGVNEAYPNCGWTVGDNGNCVINEAGTYKVDIYMDNANHIVITAL